MPSPGAAQKEALAVEILLGGIPVNIKVKQRRARARIANIAMTAKIAKI